jgi:hypothetical protein
MQTWQATTQKQPLNGVRKIIIILSCGSSQKTVQSSSMEKEKIPNTRNRRKFKYDESIAMLQMLPNPSLLEVL